MTIKILLFFLFLYVCLGWVLGFLLRSGADVYQFGLVWTAVGLILMLAFIVAARLIGWWRLWRAKAAVRPPAPASAAQVVHEDDAALAALISSASAALLKAPAYADKRNGSPLSGMSLYLLVGPEGCGKTSTFLNSGLEPQLLAGQVAGTTPLISTRLCNLWLAKGAIFAELSGRAFSGDLGRWTQLLAVLRGRPPLARWRRLFSEPEQGLVLRGVVAFCEAKSFTGASNPSLSERLSRDWQERLRAIADVFGVAFPVYQVITKSDTIPFFPDFFHRLPEPEAKQVLGCSFALRELGAASRSETSVEHEAKRLTRSFRSLRRALAERRTTHLAHEPDPARRRAIYEFPRELKRIRASLVQFLTDVFRSHPLRPNPLLRGYYLTGTREVESAAADLGASRSDWMLPKVDLGATGLFRGDATQFLRVGDPGRSSNPSGRTALTLRWMFVSDLFHSVILRDDPLKQSAPVDPHLALYRGAAFATVCAVCALLCAAFLSSWAGNRKLLQQVVDAGADHNVRRGKAVTLAELQSLEALRVEVERLTQYDRQGGPWSLRWGLYSGDGLLPAARKAYFRRFQRLVLDDLNGSLVARLEAVSTSPGGNDPYDPIYRALKTHLMISSGSCKPEPAFVSEVLKETLGGTALTPGQEEQALAERQINFYASELPYGDAGRLTEQTAARDRARQYLRKVHGVDRIYRNILANAERTLTRPQRLGDLAPRYQEVLRGPEAPSAAFTRDGWNFVQKASKENNGAALDESCVMGETAGVVGEWKQDAEVARAIQGMFVRDYIARWRNFVAGFSVARYSGPDDAARKLEILADHNSPLLAVLAMTANQTSFPTAAVEPSKLEKLPGVGPAISRVITGRKSAEKAVDKALNAQGGDQQLGPADITRTFQPVHWVVPPASETWVVETNSAYINALEQLQHSMRDIARGGNNPDPAVHQAASQNYDKALDAVVQIARGFKLVGVQGIDMAVQGLLENPIRLTKGFIISDMDKAAAGRVNGDLRVFCGHVSGILRKYPFLPSDDDVSLGELASLFSPTSGAIWKFQAQSLSELTVKDGSRWKAKDLAKKPQVTPELLTFLNRAQAIADAFYPAGAAQPQLTYTLRPKLDSSFKDSTLELEVDGSPHQWTSSLQQQFVWPAPPGTKDPGAVARIRSGSVIFPVASRGGLWGIFRIMNDAEPRPLSGKLLEWKYVRGGNGRLEPIQPAPVRLEIVEFPGGVDVFNPKFFEGSQCPSKAAQ